MDAQERKGEKPLVPGKDLQAQLEDLVGGKEIPTDQTVEYLVARFRAVQQEANNVSQALRQLDSQTAQQRKRLGELTGQLQGYAKDLEVWVKKTNRPVLEEGKTYGPAVAITPTATRAPAKP